MNDPFPFWDQRTRHINWNKKPECSTRQSQWCEIRNLDDEKDDDQRNYNGNDDWRSVADNEKSSDDTEKVRQDIWNFEQKMHFIFLKK